MQDAVYSETNEKSNFTYFRFLFFELWSFLYSKYGPFSMNFTITREKKNLSEVIFQVIVENSSKIGTMTSQNYQNMTITRKIKIWKIWNLIFHSFQNIPHLSCKFEHFNKKIGIFFSFDLEIWKEIFFLPHSKETPNGIAFGAKSTRTL